MQTAPSSIHSSRSRPRIWPWISTGWWTNGSSASSAWSRTCLCPWCSRSTRTTSSFRCSVTSKEPSPICGWSTASCWPSRPKRSQRCSHPCSTRQAAPWARARSHPSTCPTCRDSNWCWMKTPSPPRIKASSWPSLRTCNTRRPWPISPKASCPRWKPRPASCRNRSPRPCTRPPWNRPSIRRPKSPWQSRASCPMGSADRWNGPTGSTAASGPLTGRHHLQRSNARCSGSRAATTSRSGQGCADSPKP